MKMYIIEIIIIVALVTTTTSTSAAFVDDHNGRVQWSEVWGLAGDSVRLPCEVDKPTCGNFHNIKWYKGNERVFIFSEIADVKRAEGSMTERTKFYYTPGTLESYLEIFPLQTEDEGKYKCDITFINVNEACSVVQFVNLTTFALPSYQYMTYDDGTPIDDKSTIGPFDEDTNLALRCTSEGGKPVPTVTWWNGTQSLPGDYHTTVEQDGTGTGLNILNIRVGRVHLGSTLTCQAENDAMVAPTNTTITMDVNVAPSSVRAHKRESAVMEGESISLECLVKGAKPPASITWYNGTVSFQDAATTVNIEADSVELKEADGTYMTQSRLTFLGTRWENGLDFSCKASNVVLQNRGQVPLSSVLRLDVQYAPTVRVSPQNITVNETMDVLVFCQYSANPVLLTHVYWYLDSRQVDVSGNPEKYGNGDVDHPSLLVKNSSSSDMGEYTCRVANAIGASQVTEGAFVSVQYRPEVQVLMDPSDTVSEEERVNVTLICDVIHSNPEVLNRVRWYLDGSLLKELPECDGNDTLYDTESGLCDIDPSRLLLENVYRAFHGNYTCEGMNDAGWGLTSAGKELVVLYPPEQAYISYQPLEVLKGQPLILTCNVDNPGRPEATTFRWTRGSHLVPDITSSTWKMDSVSLETEDNFTCLPINSEGEGAIGSVDIDVLVKPTFITRLPPYYGALMNANEISLTCRVECSPLCSIVWYKDEIPLLNDTQYTITTNNKPPVPYSGDLESVQSVLRWRMTGWPDGELHRERDNANYTCVSSGNGVGIGESSHTYFRVEYPPERITVSSELVRVEENRVPPKVECKAWSYPEATYFWRYGSDIISTNAVLNLDYPIERFRAGDYQCVAENRHGKMTTTTVFDVTFKPECKIDREDLGSGDEAKILLICRATANPADVTFRWRMGNETLSEDVSSGPLQSELQLPAIATSLGTYYCLVNNSMGEGIPCEIDITGITGIMEKLGDDNIIMISAFVVAGILLVIIICIIICFLCRRQRQAGKYPDAGNTKDDIPHKTGSAPTSSGSCPPTDPAGVPLPGSKPKDNGIPSPDDDDRTFYENLPFHGMQPPPNKPLITDLGGDLEYADVDYSTYTYGPIPYKAASVLAAQEMKAEREAEKDGVPVRPPRKK